MLIRRKNNLRLLKEEKEGEGDSRKRERERDHIKRKLFKMSKQEVVIGTH